MKRAKLGGTPHQVRRDRSVFGAGRVGAGMTEEPRSEMHRQRWILVLAAAASFLVGLDALVVTTALPTIRHELGASLSSLEWTINAYTLSFAVLLMSAAALGDRYGRRRMLCFGVGLFGAASVVCAVAPSAGVLVAARAAQGS
jgi:MFS family permease